METTARARSPRSMLFVPADRALALLPKALRSGADAVIIDLEDAVAPAARPAARLALGEALRFAPPCVPCFVRVNPVDHPDFEADVAATVGLAVAGLLVAKCERPDVAARVAAAWTGAGSPPPIIALLETPAGVLDAAAIARSSPSIIGLALGAEDLALNTGMRRTATGDEILVARSLIVLAAAAAGCWAIDTPSLELEQMDVVARDADRAAGLGLTGKLLIHPRQVASVNAAFGSTADELAAARQTVATADAMEAAGGAVARDAGRMIDRPVIEAARRLLARANHEAKETP